MKNKKILISGASGFIGSHLTKRLHALGAEVTIITRYNSVIDNVRLSPIWNDIHVFEADIRNLDSLAPLKKEKFDAVFHLAAYNHVGSSFLHIQECFDSNAKGTANLLESCKDYSRFVYISSSEIYGHQAKVPFEEEFNPAPISPYSIGKYAGELYCRMRHHVDKLPITFLRPFNAFGPYQSSRAIIPELIINSLSGKEIKTTEGKQTREFNYVENLVDGFLLAAINPKAIGEIINLGSGVEIPIRELVQKIHALCHSKSELKIGSIPYRPTEIWRMSASNKKAKDILGWTPKIMFDDGLKQTIEWFKNYLITYHDPVSQLNKL